MSRPGNLSATRWLRYSLNCRICRTRRNVHAPSLISISCLEPNGRRYAHHFNHIRDVSLWSTPCAVGHTVLSRHAGTAQVLDLACGYFIIAFVNWKVSALLCVMSFGSSSFLPAANAYDVSIHLLRFYYIHTNMENGSHERKRSSRFSRVRIWVWSYPTTLPEWLEVVVALRRCVCIRSSMRVLV